MFRLCLLVAMAVACALPGVASANTRTLGLRGWQVRSSAASDWLAVHPDDAGAPGTEIDALLQNGGCPDVFFSTRMKDCFGYTDQWARSGASPCRGGTARSSARRATVTPRSWST